MRADLPGVAVQRILADGVVVGFECIEVAIHRSFGIDHDGLSTGQTDDEVGSEIFALIGGGTVLHLEITMFLHAGEFDDTAELHFAPLAASGGLAESLDERRGLTLEAELAFAERADLLLELGVCTFAGFFNFTDAEFEFPERLGDWLDQCFDGDFAFFNLALRLLGLSGEGGFGELQKLLGAGLESIGGERLEGIGKFDFGAFEQRLFLGGGLHFAVEAGANLRELVAECLGVLLVALRLSGRLGEAGLDLRGASHFRFKALGGRGGSRRHGQVGEQPAEK